MSLIPVRFLDPTFLGTVAATFYTATGKIVISRFVIVNINTGASEVVTIYLNTADNQHTLIQSQSIPAGQPYFAPELAGLVLNQGDTLKGFCVASASSVQCYGSGFQG